MDADLGDILMEKDGLIKKLDNNMLHCTGCSACENKCPTNAIEMVEDETGFFRPFIFSEKCVQCGQCINVCPILNNFPNCNTYAPDCYAIQADDTTRKNSSSGGLFALLAKKVLHDGGIVVGAAIAPDLTVRHICIQSEEELPLLQKSKYVQSNVSDIYKQVKTYLASGRRVLFTGTPCQVAALHAVIQEKTNQLITVDIICHGVPSSKMMRESLSEQFKAKQITHVDFRDKNYGWDSLNMTITFSDGNHQRISYDESPYEQGFHHNLTLQESCYQCKFCDFPRQGDLSIGDFWRIEDFDQKLNDHKGTSALLINSECGHSIWKQIQSECKLSLQVPISYLSHNRIYPDKKRHPARDYFLYLYSKRPFNLSVRDALQGHHDVAIVGNWSYPNYGSELTYYALYRVITSTGRTAVMLSWPKSAKWKPYANAQLFKQNPYPQWDIAEIPESRQELRKYNQLSDIFILGSDQLLNNNLYNWFDKFMQLDWVTNNKYKIAYSASFGTDYIWGSDEDRAEMAHFLHQFDSFSVREKSGQTLLKQYFDVASDLVLDPVFLMPNKVYQELIEKGIEVIPAKPFLFSYILDLSENKSTFLKSCSTKLNLPLFSISDAAPEDHRHFSDFAINTVYHAKLENWLACIQKCEYMITDSFHGMCVAIILHKQFLVIGNESRGMTRFTSLLEQLGLQDRLITCDTDMNRYADLLGEQIDYLDIENKLSALRNKSQKWLFDALNATQTNKSLSTFDLLAPRLDRQEMNTVSLDETDAKQWAQLEDHRLRLDGVDDRIRILEEQNAQLSQLLSNLKMQYEKSNKKRLFSRLKSQFKKARFEK